RLQHLEISNNAFTRIEDRLDDQQKSPIPQSISKLVNLETLLAYPSFRGTIPNLSNLKKLSFSDKQRSRVAATNVCPHMVNMRFVQSFDQCDKLLECFTTSQYNNIIAAGLEPWAKAPTCAVGSTTRMVWRTKSSKIECDAQGRITKLSFMRTVYEVKFPPSISKLSIFGFPIPITYAVHHLFHAHNSEISEPSPILVPTMLPDDIITNTLSPSDDPVLPLTNPSFRITRTSSDVLPPHSPQLNRYPPPFVTSGATRSNNKQWTAWMLPIIC
ncbi:hypothetical protein BC829DRAFT_378449, partial [Chytridium lagenaria]